MCWEKQVKLNETSNGQIALELPEYLREEGGRQKKEGESSRAVRALKLAGLSLVHLVEQVEVS
jgi:hypothetical protein